MRLFKRLLNSTRSAITSHGSRRELVKRKANEQLNQSPAFHALPVELQQQVANDTAKVAGYIAGTGERIDGDFPEFVSGLIGGVFEAVVDASIEQMEANAELIAGVAASVDEFIGDDVSDAQARARLVERNPALQIEAPFNSRLFANVNIGASASNSNSNSEANREGSRQQLLATMVMMGINRIVVSDGEANAAVDFSVQRSGERSGSARDDSTREERRD